MSDGEKDESKPPEEAGSDDIDQDEIPGPEAAEAQADDEPAGAKPDDEDEEPDEAAPAPGPAETEPDEAPPAETKPPESEDTVPPGNPLHPVRGTLIALLGAAIPFLLMTTDRHFGFSVPVGLAGCLIATFGIFDLLGTFDDPVERVTERISSSAVGSRLVELAAAGSALFLFLRLAVAGTLPYPRLTAALLITGAFLWCVVSVYRVGEALGPWKTDETGKARSLLYRHGFWLVVFTALIYLPLLGSYSLSDPWETHYGEVSREMLARDDWISLWWAQDGWFWSKPVFDFWIQGLFFSALGVGFMPDKMLIGASHGRFPEPEWAARMPVFLLTLIGGYLLYKGVAKVFGRRAGLLGGLVLVTMPYWFLIAHQTMTDMPYVGPLTAAMGLLLLGLFTDSDERVKVYELKIRSRAFRLSGYHLLFGIVVLCVLPQILYLASRNLTLQLDAAPHGFLPHLDAFFSGSGGGNCGLPGNEACRKALPVNRDFQPWHASLLWGAVAGFLLWINRGERRKNRLYFIAAWLMVALSALGKGAPGLVLPIFIAGVYIAATKRWKDLTRMELLGLLLVVCCVTLPWYVQMFMRHGQPFTDRLLFHDMYKRAFVHVHDTNVGDDVSFRYYIWQLGYGLFPWTGLAAGALVWWTRRRNEVSDPRGDAGAFLGLWFISAFSMFTITLTKFHHYIFPVVPPTAALVGVLLDHCLDRAELPEKKRLIPYSAGMLGSATLLVYGAFRLFPGSIIGRTLEGHKPPGATLWLAITSLCLGIALGIFTVAVYGRRSGESDASLTPSRRFDAAMLGALGLASAAVVLLAGRDLFVTAPGDIEGQARLMHLFTYNYRRPWPASLDFKGIFTGFTIIASAACALFVVRKLRTHAAALLLATSVMWAAWGVNVYLFRAAPHWGQRETVLAYYRDRPGPEAPFVAYQMNWKGENFYMGNRVPAFVASGQKFKDWVAAERKRGVTTMYFTTEHGRMGSLKSELGNPKDFTKITDEDLNNKFFVGRVRF